MRRPERPDLRELVGDEGEPEELERLRRVHELIVAAGPPPELSPALAEPPRVGREAFRLRRPRRRLEAVLVLAAGALALMFGIGYYLGAREGGFETEFTVAMRGVGEAAPASASIRVGEVDEEGNWPLLLTVRGLEPLPKGGWYELYLSRKGKPVVSCGTFRTTGEVTEVRLNAPYKLKEFDGWVVTAHLPGGRRTGVVMTT